MAQAAPQKARKITVENASAENIQTQIQMLAYQLWLDRGAPIGSPEADWYEAEARLSRTKTASQ